MSTSATHHVTPIDLDSLGPVDPTSPEAALERTIALTVLGTTGVHALGTPSARLVGVVRSRLGAGGVTGVTVTQTATGLQVDVALVAEYPTDVTELAETIRTQVAHAVGQLDGEPVTIDVSVVDVHGPFDDVAEEEPADEVDGSADAGAGEAPAGSDPGTGGTETLRERASGVVDSARDAIADAIDGTADAVDGVVGEARDAAARDASERDDRAAPVAHDDAADAERQRASADDTTADDVTGDEATAADATAADATVGDVTVAGSDEEAGDPAEVAAAAAEAAADAAQAAARAADAAADAARAATTDDDRSA